MLRTWRARLGTSSLPSFKSAKGHREPVRTPLPARFGTPAQSASRHGGFMLSRSLRQISTVPQHRSIASSLSRTYSTAAVEDDFNPIENIRNVAVVAHVDHGKTTLVDKLLTHSSATTDTRDRLMDSNDLEKERGITILSKCASLEWRGTRINLVDTPGHKDFGGEVERVLGMVDGVFLLVDAIEGPMPQTRFVLQKALSQGLHPILVINKVDREGSRPDEVEGEVFDLMATLGASDEQLDFTTIYASARDGWATRDLSKKEDNVFALLDAIIENVPPPRANTDENAPFKMLVSQLDSQPHIGRLLTGRILQGTVRPNDRLKAMDVEGNTTDQGRVVKVFHKKGLDFVPSEEGRVGDIVSVGGFSVATVSHTLGEESTLTEPLDAIPIDPPTLSMTFFVNDSPFAGRDGKFLTSNMIKDRLYKELESNVSLTIDTPSSEAFEVKARGELQISVLIETMRREGFELSVSPPRVVFQQDKNGNKLEPLEEVTIEVLSEYSGKVMDQLTQRKGELLEIKPVNDATRLRLIVPSRGLLGYRSQFLSQTRGSGIMHSIFHGYGDYRGDLPQLRKGAIISMAQGSCTAYSLQGVEARGQLFIGPQTEVYPGMIIGEHSRSADLEVNPVKGKKLTNMRASGTDENVILSPPRVLTLEDVIAYVQDDEIIEVTPKAIRLRKRFLDSNQRKKK